MIFKVCIKSCISVWMSNLKFKSWSDSNWCSQHKVMLGKVIFHSRTLRWWIFWSEKNCSLLPDCSLFNSRFWSLEKGSLSKRSCLSHHLLITIAKFDYKIKSGDSRYLSKKGSVKFHKNYLELYNLLFSYSLWEARYKL